MFKLDRKLAPAEFLETFQEINRKRRAMADAIYTAYVVKGIACGAREPWELARSGAHSRSL